jgi:long-chain acyl-CoA synthetase
VVTALGDLLPAPKGWLVNLVVRHVKKMVPAFDLPSAVRFNDALNLGRGHALNPVRVVHEDIAFLQYTGGTTGIGEGRHADASQRRRQHDAGGCVDKPFLVGPQTVITALPLYHIFALTANCLVFLKLGAKNVLITNPRDIPGFVKELSKHRFSVITGVNTLFNALLNNPDFEKLDFSGLKVSLGGGMAVQRAVAERWKKVTGLPLIEAYGLTETSPAVCINRPDQIEFTGAIGLPVSSTEISIRNDSGDEVPVGESGELCVRGPQVMKGYYRRPDETAKVMTPDGYLRTGDIATIDESGLVRIVDRKKDMILVSGFNVYPNEVEEVVARCAGVLECCAVGIPDEHSGESVKVFIVRKDPALNEATVIAHCRAELTAYKVPRKVEFRDELPKTNVGKDTSTGAEGSKRQAGGVVFMKMKSAAGISIPFCEDQLTRAAFNSSTLMLASQPGLRPAEPTSLISPVAGLRYLPGAIFTLAAAAGRAERCFGAPDSPRSAAERLYFLILARTSAIAASSSERRTASACC